ncbi:hypothetical protein T12_10601 [Trichinella patagoniensis]|uniref:Uncharacterized protein n=1 Tax=Trichinella patagoniensis TaxID=990121 RepID=A0A0V1A6Q0_9BILA|nr:hypothetical protein T12_10601 [Trichinella patagoniensis]
MAVPHHQAIIMEAESAMAAENVRKNMHIVDIVLSCEEEAIRQVEKLRKLMESGNGLVEDHQQVKTLGMIWNCENDELNYNSHRRSKDKCMTVNIRWRRRERHGCINTFPLYNWMIIQRYTHYIATNCGRRRFIAES